MSDDKAAPLHPPPWRWDKYGDLEDAKGYEVLVNPGEGGCGVSTASPYVRELVRAAPEMEALLREVDPCGAVHQTEASRAECWWCRIRVLLARIDEASRG